MELIYDLESPFIEFGDYCFDLDTFTLEVDGAEHRIEFNPEAVFNGAEVNGDEVHMIFDVGRIIVHTQERRVTTTQTLEKIIEL